jgi:protein-S-isoprenylcysteine O-methyltransferase Ste14
MYLGGILMFLGAPVLIGSSFGVLVGCALTVLLMARILGEEAMLTRELEGYQEYTQEVRYRLVPFLW